ncbi:DNA-directed DNA polymerase [Cellulomonas flavigena DSM 20109]|uniref:DNA polymerase IV n=1 Tax=Cellulomonas flavigena (strain ATCC 482 / DSM 20109 / BCRC 11376 / JCM 18109 / NBRC 3775 / NCIMB 8073 / NRS 134) TaxID=446466 RepID=D5UFN7_CELFN|nr:DNA polymerase IV [Cellulomonas flavigena]ADG72996.1 DNA-directed DNA polymerase [Cellulomonas flavigena DSM 20109]
MERGGDRAQRLVDAVRVRDAATVLHLDADAFFAAVEQRDKPSLRGRPVLVGGTGGRGVVSTASYEARRDGARSAMPMSRARRLSPAAAVLFPRFAAYAAYSQVIMGVLRDLTPAVEPLSIDEAFADLTLAPGGTPEPEEAAAQVQARVTELTGLTVSVGVGRSKLVAKIASDLRKPGGVVVVRPEDEDDVLLPLDVRKVPGVGPATQGALERLGVRTVADLRRQPLDTLTMTLGEAHGTGLYLMSRGLDDRPVVTTSERKSAGAERTFAVDLRGRDVVLSAVDDVVDEALQRLERHGGAARTVVAKVRYADFSTVTRSVTFPHPTASGSELRDAARRAVLAAGVVEPVRLLGVAFHSLSSHAQLALDLDAHLFDAPRRAVVGEHDHVSGRLVDDVASSPEGMDTADGEVTGVLEDGEVTGVLEDGEGTGVLEDGEGAPTLGHDATGSGGDTSSSTAPAVAQAGAGDVPEVDATVARLVADDARLVGAEKAVVGRPLGAPVTGRPLDEANARPGLDVEHATLGRGWVVHVRGREATVRFETALTAPARSRVLDLDEDPLVLVEPVGVTPPSVVPAHLR